MSSIREISEAEIKDIYPLLAQLRPQIDEMQFYEIYKAARAADDFRFFGYFENAICTGLMGARVLTDFVHLRHLYIDDLVVLDGFRSKGVGAELLKFAGELARIKDCVGMRLCTGVENKAGIRFYEREGWSARALAFKKKLIP